MVTDDNRTLWLVIGIITLGVMVFCRRTFLPSASEEPENRTATMDTLVAPARVRHGSTHERERLATVVPDGSPPSIMKRAR